MLGSDYATNPAFQWAKVDSSGSLYINTIATVSAMNLTKVGGAAIALGQTTMANSFPVVIASDQSAVPVSQSGSWTVAATQSGVWSVGRTWTLGSGTDSVAAVQSGTWTVQQGTPPWSVSQSGTWTVQQGTPPWSVSQSGSWSVTATGSTTPSDAFANPTTALLDFSLLGAFNGTNWERVRSATAINNNAVMTTPTGVPMVALAGGAILVASGQYAPISVIGTQQDALSNTATFAMSTVSELMAFNGTTWDRVSSANRSINGQFSAGILGVGVGLIGSTSQVAWSAAGFTGDGNNGLTAGQVGLELYNGSTWDRTRSIPAATGTTGTGLLGVGMLAFDATGGTNYQRIECEAEGDARTRSSYFQLVVGSSESVFNGSTWDRLRSATALSNSTAGLGVTLANYNNSATGLLPTVILGYDNTTNANAYRVLQFEGASPNLRMSIWNSTLEAAVANFAADAVANASMQPSLAVATASMGFNGTTWDRVRTTGGANGTSGTGLLGAGLLAYDAVSTTFGTLLLESSSSKNLRVGIYQGSNEMTINANGPSADAYTAGNLGNGLIALVTQSIYNGSTFDRMRSANVFSTNYPTGLLGVGLLVRNASASSATAVYDISGQNVDALSSGSLVTVLFSFNGATYDRVRTATALSNSTAGAAVTLANYNNAATGILPSLVMGYDPTTNANAYRALQVTSGGILLAAQSGTWTVQQGGAPWSVSQSGTWNIGTVTTVTTVSTVTTLSQFPSTAALADATANPTLTQIQVFPMGFNGTTWDRLQVDASKRLLVLATQSGTWNIGTLTTLSQFPSAAALSDAFANPTTTQIGAMLMGWNTSTWDRLQVDSSKRLKVVNQWDATGVVNNPADVSVSSAAALSMSTNLFQSVTLLADDQNGDSILVGNSTRQTYVLRPGASITLNSVIPNNIYVKAKSGTQTLHVIGGGT